MRYRQTKGIVKISSTAI
uniref:Uncharacterized protein n=1 Tax=Arundo donax TaxID=35708 RepID=A0A0A9B382_ARUDO